MRAFFLLKKEVIVFIEREFLLLKGFPKVDTYILGFKEVSVTLAELVTLFLKISKDIVAIYLIGVYKIMGFLSHGEAIFSIVNLILIYRISIMVGVHFLY